MRNKGKGKAKGSKAGKTDDKYTLDDIPIHAVIKM